VELELYSQGNGSNLGKRQTADDSSIPLPSFRAPNSAANPISRRNSDADRASVTAEGTTDSQALEIPLLQRHARFASRELLCPWFPEADPTHKRAQTLSVRLSRRNSVLTAACIVSWLVLVMNCIGTIGIRRLHSEARLFTGDCVTANRLDSGLHVVINLLSSLLLGASNLCMQLLSAPTRAEIDKAHKRRIWLDIGIPSVKNLKYIAAKRKVVWIFLALASLPLHFL
jgi:hypothetical protein